jgi:hypothetical protein
LIIGKNFIEDVPHTIDDAIHNLYFPTGALQGLYYNDRNRHKLPSTAILVAKKLKVLNFSIGYHCYTTVEEMMDYLYSLMAIEALIEQHKTV